VPVPAGIEDGQTVRMPVGTKEVYITFKVEKSDYFTRKGADVHTDATISLAQVHNLKTALFFFSRISGF
jgi:DnaJ family protein A protein 3